MNIADVAWIDVKDKLTQTDLLILPLGATETYGRHLAMGMENVVADYVARELGKRLDCLVAPTIPVTWSEGNDAFPGNLWVSPAVLKAYIKDVCDRMIDWGIKRIFFLNLHGPNLGVLDELGLDYHKHGVRCAQVDFWRFVIRLVPDVLKGEKPHAWGHASELAVSVALAIQPELVFADRFQSFIPNESLATAYPDLRLATLFSDSSPSGNTGDPSLGTAETGQEALRRTVERLEQFLRAWV